jgi:PKD repeat protein
MKKLLSIFIFLLVAAMAKAQTCSATLSHILQSNGAATLQWSITAPPGMNGMMQLSFLGGSGQFMPVDSSITGSYTAQFYSNDTVVVGLMASFINPVDSSNCSCTAMDTFVISNYSCVMVMDSILFSNYSGLNQNFSINYYTSPNNSAVPYWRVEDSTGVIFAGDSGNAMLTYSFPYAGAFRVWFVATGIDGASGVVCGDSSYLDVVLYDTCGLDAQVNTVINPDGSVIITGVSGGANFATQHIFINGNIGFPTDSINYQFTTSGTYQVCYYIEDTLNSGCLDYDCQMITINVPPVSCNANFYIYQDSITPSIWHGVNVSSGPSTLTYFWDFGDGTSSTQPALTHNYATPGSYVICLTVADSASGCTSTHCDSSAAFRLSTNALMSTLVITQPAAVGIASHEADAPPAVVFPNPMTDVATLQFTSSLATAGKIEVVGILGNKVVSENISVTKGPNEFHLNTANLANGVYSINIIAGSQVLGTVKAVK